MRPLAFTICLLLHGPFGCNQDECLALIMVQGLATLQGDHHLVTRDCIRQRRLRSAASSPHAAYR